MRFIVREIHYTAIIMSSEFEALSKSLMVEIVRRRQLQMVCALVYPLLSLSVCSSLIILYLGYSISFSIPFIVSPSESALFW